MVDQDEKWLIDCLAATLDTMRDVRSFAEASLHEASLQQGFGAALAKAAVNNEIPFSLRQLAAVLLKQFIKQHWQEDTETFIHPVVLAEEKAIIRQLLPPALCDPHGKIRTAVSMAVASIAQFDWPEDWPELMPFLLRLISDQRNTDGIRGSLRCLSLLSDDLDDTLVPKLVPILFPYLDVITSSPQSYDKSLRTKALSIIHSCISVLGAMSGVYKAETSALVASMLNSLVKQFSVILQSPLQHEDSNDWSMRMEVLKCLMQYIQSFPSVVEAHFSVIATPLWQTFVSSLEVYKLSSIQGNEASHSESNYDSDGTEKTLDSFIIQLFELFLSITGSSKLAKAIGGNIRELVYYTIAFLQITEEQVNTWSSDANQYVADEDNNVTHSCRVSGFLLLEEVAQAYAEDGIRSVLEAAEKRISESCQLKVSGSTEWWKLCEAALFALAALSEHFTESKEYDLIRLSLGNILNQFLTEDILFGFRDHPLLYARIFSSVAKFCSVLTVGICDQIVLAAMEAISSAMPPPAIVGACRALSVLLPQANPEMVQLHIVGLFQCLTGILKQASDETLQLVLETLQAAVKAAHEQFASIEPVLSPIVLDVWVQHVSEPFISFDALEVLEAIKKAPGCMWPFVSRVLPSIKCILESAHQQAEGLVAGSLDLLTMILKSSPVDVVRAVFDTCFVSCVQIILESNDHAEMQNATECLAALVSGGKQELLSWGRDIKPTMERLLVVANRLLDPNMESSGTLFLGSYLLQIIFHFPLQISPHIHDLVAAIVRRMESCEGADLKSDLIVTIARLVHMSSPNVAQFINLMLSLPANNHDSSLSYLMSEWTKIQGEIQGAYYIKVTTTALALLLSTGHAELAKINVQGHIIKSSLGIITRSKAKAAPDQWTVVTLPSKIFSVLSDALIEIQEQALSEGDEEDSDWEDVPYGDGGNPLEILYSVSVPRNSQPSVEHLDAMAKAFNDSEDGGEDDLMHDDPLYEINLAEYLKNFFLEFRKTNPQAFEQLCLSSTQPQRKAIQAIVN